MTNINKALGRFMKSSERLVKLADFEEFFDGLKDTLNAIIDGSTAEEPTKKSLNQATENVMARFKTLPVAKQAEFIELLEKASDVDFARLWQELGARFDPSSTYNAESVEDIFDGMGRPEDPDKGSGRQPLPPSSVPAPRVSAGVAKALDKLADASPEDIERAKSGLTQLDNEELKKEGQRTQVVEGQVDAETEAALYRGEVASETAVRKGLVRGAVALTERIEKLLNEADAGITLT